VSGEAAKEQQTVESQAQQTAIKHYAEMQSAPRFPLHLPVEVKSQDGACTAETQNISANGVLFAMDRDVPVGSTVDFTILLPGDVVVPVAMCRLTVTAALFAASKTRAVAALAW
jgi:hypothetical protein